MLLEPYGDVSHYRVKINHSVVLSRHWPALAVGKRGVCALDGVDGAAVEVVATKAAELRAQMASAVQVKTEVVEGQVYPLSPQPSAQ